LLPGRESRIWEQPYTDLETLAHDLCEALAPAIDRPFALFGHSMGALIAFDLARQMRRTTGLAPLHLFASACRAPQSPDSEPPLHELPQTEFFARLRAMNYGPDEIYDHPQFLEMLLPTVRADYRLCERYEYRNERPLECPITTYGGLEDQRVTPADLDGWSVQTEQRFTRVMFPGGHLFLHHQEAAIADSVVTELDRTLATTKR
jgi:medium-chain acyl-[acyl-carrier-protein] hydrolase